MTDATIDSYSARNGFVRQKKDTKTTGDMSRRFNFVMDGCIIAEQDCLKDFTEVDVKYTFGALNNKVDKDYSLKIIPNNIPDKDFTYTVDGEMKYFQSETDLSDGFEIDKGEKSFRIKPKGETISEVLSAVYGKSITDCESKGYTNMFTVIVTSYNGEASVKLDFSLAIRVAGITLDKEAILF